MKHKHNAGCGDRFCFHGAFKEKRKAIEKEQKTPGGFVRGIHYGVGDYRYAVLTPRQDNPKGPGRRRTRKNPTAKCPQCGGRAKQIAQSQYAGVIARYFECRKCRYKFVEHEKTKENPLFTRAEKRRMKKKIKHAVKGAARRGLLKLFGRSQPRAAVPHKSHRSTERGSESGIRADVISALVNQGYSRATASRMVPQAGAGDTFDSLFRRAMKRNPEKPPSSRDIEHARAKLSQARQALSLATTRAQKRQADEDVQFWGNKLAFLVSWAKNVKHNPPRRKSRRNPEDDPESRQAQEAFHKFHGADPRKVSEVIQKIVDQGKFWLLGKLYGYDLAQFPLVKDGRKDVRPNVDCLNANIQLCAEPESKQLFLWGGAQDLEWALKSKFGIASNVQFVVLGVINRIWYITRKKFDGFEVITYIHRFGEKGGEKPLLMYDRLNKQQWIVGGDYKIKPEGIDD